MIFRKKTLLIALAQCALAGAALSATFDVDGDLMRGIDDTAKSLDSNVAQKDAAAATADAVGFAHRTGELAQQALKAIEAKDFDAAGNAVNDLTRSCKTCHEVYKKD